MNHTWFESTSILTRTYNMLTIFSPCACDQSQQDHERVHGVHKPEAKVRHRGDVPIFLKDHPAHTREGVPGNKGKENTCE